MAMRPTLIKQSPRQLVDLLHCLPAPRCCLLPISCVVVECAASQGSHRSSGVSLSLSLDGAAGCSPVRNQLNGSWVYSGAPYGPNNRTSAPYTMQLTEVS